VQQLPQLAAEQQSLLQLAAEKGLATQQLGVPLPAAAAAAVAAAVDHVVVVEAATEVGHPSSSSSSSSVTFGAGVGGAPVMPGQYRAQKKGECVHDIKVIQATHLVCMVCCCCCCWFHEMNAYISRSFTHPVSQCLSY
jgi:hypothetical protein